MINTAPVWVSDYNQRQILMGCTTILTLLLGQVQIIDVVSSNWGGYITNSEQHPVFH